MYLLLRAVVPANRLIVIHAHLPEVEWAGTTEHIRTTIGDTEYHQVQARKTFFEMVERRGMWPSSATRQCTSDLKRGPITKRIVAICNNRGFTKVVNCMGLRAEESSGRAKKEPFKLHSNSNSRRTWYEWLPIHKWKLAKVLGWISQHGQQPHWAYSNGMSRLSCCFCIMASKDDLRTAAWLNPELAQRYMDTERRLNHTLLMPSKKHGQLFLEDIIS